jgi:predicted HD superfamily hydrolase involved in NAD metabolism
MHVRLAQLLQGVPLTGCVQSDVIAVLSFYGYTNTIEHCQRVAVQAKGLAGQFGADPSAARMAGWLHDVSALFPVDQRLSIARELGVDVLPEEEKAPMLLHQKLSAVMAREIFCAVDGAVLSAVECHTTLKANASTLDKVLFVADKIAWDQPGVPPYALEITEALGSGLATQRPLDEAALCYLEFLWHRRAELAAVHPWFVQAYHALREIRRQEAE